MEGRTSEVGSLGLQNSDQSLVFGRPQGRPFHLGELLNRPVLGRIWRESHYRPSLFLTFVGRPVRSVVAAMEGRTSEVGSLGLQNSDQSLVFGRPQGHPFHLGEFLNRPVLGRIWRESHYRPSLFLTFVGRPVRSVVAAMERRTSEVGGLGLQNSEQSLVFGQPLGRPFHLGELLNRPLPGRIWRESQYRQSLFLTFVGRRFLPVAVLA